MTTGGGSQPSWRSSPGTSSCDDATAKLHFGEMIATSYLEGRGPFQERLPLSGLMWRFLWEYHVTVLRWARWARDQVQAWPQDMSRLDVTEEFGRIIARGQQPLDGLTPGGRRPVLSILIQGGASGRRSLPGGGAFHDPP